MILTFEEFETVIGETIRPFQIAQYIIEMKAKVETYESLGEDKETIDSLRREISKAEKCRISKLIELCKEELNELGEEDGVYKLDLERKISDYERILQEKY